MIGNRRNDPYQDMDLDDGYVSTVRSPVQDAGDQMPTTLGNDTNVDELVETRDLVMARNDVLEKKLVRSRLKTGLVVVLVAALAGITFFAVRTVRDNGDLTNQMNHMKEQSSALSDKETENGNQIADLNSQIDSLRDQVDQANKSRDSSVSAKNKAEDTNKELQEKIASLETRAQQAESAADGSNDELQRAQDQINDLNREIDVLNEELRIYQEDDEGSTSPSSTDQDTRRLAG